MFYYHIVSVYADHLIWLFETIIICQCVGHHLQSFTKFRAMNIMCRLEFMILQESEEYRFPIFTFDFNPFIMLSAVFMVTNNAVSKLKSFSRRNYKTFNKIWLLLKYIGRPKFLGKKNHVRKINKANGLRFFWSNSS